MKIALQRIGEQVEGIAAQLLFGIPVLVASVLVARIGRIELVSDLAFAAGVSATVFTALSVGLRPLLATRGLRNIPERAFWQNRGLAIGLGVLASLALCVGWGIGTNVAMSVILLKACDGLADLRNGFDLVATTPRSAARRLLGWGTIRGAMFGCGCTVALLLDASAGTVILAGACAQALLLFPRELRSAALQPPWRSRDIVALAKLGFPFSVSAIACALLITVPRGLAPHVLSVDRVGLAGIAFMAGTFIGMSFNVVWLRSAVLARTKGAKSVRMRLLFEGGIVAICLIVGVVLFNDLAAWVFGVDPQALRYVLTPVASALILVYFGMSFANLLKVSRWPLAEAVSYLTAAAVLTVSVLMFESLAVGIAIGGVALFVAVELFAWSRIGIE